MGYDERPPVKVHGCKHLGDSRSGKAIKVEFEDGGTAWIPKSQLKDGNELNEDGDEGTLVISAWIAGEKGIHTNDGSE